MPAVKEAEDPGKEAEDPGPLSPSGSRRPDSRVYAASAGDEYVSGARKPGFLVFLIQLYRTQSVGRCATIVAILGVVVLTIGLGGLVPMLVVEVGATIFGLELLLLGTSFWSAAAGAP